MEHLKVYSFLAILVILVVGQANARPNRPRIEPTARDENFGRQAFNRNEGNRGISNGRFDRPIGGIITEVMNKVDHVMQSLSHRFHKKQICSMNYNNSGDNSTGDFTTACPLNFNCVADNRTFSIGNFSVKDVKRCEPETNCSNMVCLPWETCISPSSIEEFLGVEGSDADKDIEEDDESDESEEDDESDESEEDDESDEEEESDEENSSGDEDEVPAEENNKRNNKDMRKRKPGNGRGPEDDKRRPFHHGRPKYAHCVMAIRPQ